jgi:BirA family biotin operon repressor/biotin-[acetyl-CoA-carboxylase] ligase
MNKDILEELYDNPCEYVSGQRLCELLGVSRTAVWKHIRELEKQGYDIKAESGKGYMLNSDNDVLNEYEINRRLRRKTPVNFVKTAGSTNELAKKMAGGTTEDFSLFVSERQTGGRGRMGRSFESDTDKGVWCSFLLKPEMEPEKALSITIASSIAVCRTLEGACSVKAGIKWPNDVILSGGKVCGILSEMVCETGRIQHIVIGIGINVLQEKMDFTPEIRDRAVSLFTETGKKFKRADIISALCYNMQEVYTCLKRDRISEVMESWSEYTVTDGKRIRIIKNGESLEMNAKGIDGQGRLTAEDRQGNIHKFNSGEISIRGVMGYI